MTDDRAQPPSAAPWGPPTLPRPPVVAAVPSRPRPAGRLRRFATGRPSASALASLGVVGVVLVARSILTPASYGTPTPAPTLPPVTTFPVIVGVVTPTACPPMQQDGAEESAGLCAMVRPTTAVAPPGADDGP